VARHLDLQLEGGGNETGSQAGRVWAVVVAERGRGRTGGMGGGNCCLFVWTHIWRREWHVAVGGSRAEKTVKKTRPVRAARDEWEGRTGSYPGYTI
jgi:hypothetical protein